AADPRHAPKARRVRGQGRPDRGVPLRHARVPAVGDRGRVELLGKPAAEAGGGASSWASGRGPIASGYTEPDPRDDLSGADVGRKALILGRLLGFAGEPDDVVVESRVPAALRSLRRDAFVARLGEMDADWAKRSAVAKAKGATL